MFTHIPLTLPVLTQHTEENGDRYYTREGSDYRYSSVTRFIGENWDKKFLDKWKKRVGLVKAASQSKWATERGTSLHTITEKYLSNDEAGYREILNEDRMNKGLFLKIKPELNKISNIRVLEKALYSDELKLAGTSDVIADYDGVFSTIDIKGSTKEKLESYISNYWIQTAIYSRMFQELFNTMPMQSVILMAVEDNPTASVFIEPSMKGQLRLQEFLSDPVVFQENLNEAKKRARN